jgi:uncharacterized membrane protein
MYKYTWYQWILFFYIYCFLGWVFESAYVSLRKRHFVNRGFLQLPLLPLYGTGAVMMLWLSLPLKDNLILVYLAGVLGATVLEYVTGWGMEQLFKIKYWDYSDQRFNFHGYICLSSSIAWGFLTILLTEVIHRPIEYYVLGLPAAVALTCTLSISLLFALDSIHSIKTALDFAKVLDTVTRMRAELEEMQVQMALLKAETNDRMDEMREETAERLDAFKAEAEEAAGRLKEALSDHFEDRLYDLSQKASEIRQRRRQLLNRMEAYRHSLLRRNPSATSRRFEQALKELRDEFERDGNDR